MTARALSHSAGMEIITRISEHSACLPSSPRSKSRPCATLPERSRNKRDLNLTCALIS